jgi:hypothetical protein
MPTRKDIQQGLTEAGYAIMDADVARSLKSMRERGYVTEHEGSPLTYSLSTFASITQHDIGLDWSRIVEEAKEGIYDPAAEIPEVVADAYVEKFCEGVGLFAVDPYTGESVNILEDATLQDVIDARTEAVAEVVSNRATADGGRETESAKKAAEGSPEDSEGEDSATQARLT